MHIQGSPTKIQTPNTLYRDRPQHDYPAACVIAQQYSPATFLSLRFHFRNKKFGERLKNVISLFSLFQKSGYVGEFLYLTAVLRSFLKVATMW
jgi:hypothetical protein